MRVGLIIVLVALALTSRSIAAEAGLPEIGSTKFEEGPFDADTVARIAGRSKESLLKKSSEPERITLPNGQVCFRCHANVEYQLGMVRRGVENSRLVTSPRWRREIFKTGPDATGPDGKPMVARLKLREPVVELIWVKYLDGSDVPKEKVVIAGAGQQFLAAHEMGGSAFEVFYEAEKSCPKLEEQIGDLDGIVYGRGNRRFRAPIETIRPAAPAP